MSESSIQNRQKRENPPADCESIHSVGGLDALQEVVSGASLEIVQLERGRLQGEFKHVELGGSSVHFNQFNLSVRGRGPSSVTRWTFVLVSERVEGMFNCQPLKPSRVITYRPGAEFAGTTKGHFEDWVFTVEDAILRQVAQRLFRCELPNNFGSTAAMQPPPGLLAKPRQIAASALALDSPSEGLGANFQLQAQLHWELVEHLAGVLVTGATDRVTVGQRSTHSHSRIVQIAEGYLSAQPDAMFTIAELCMVADVSERTLRNAFQSVLGLNPNAYIKMRRLHLARRRLERATGERATVTKIALSSGFRHLGNFSQDYRKFFGESPARTLAAPDVAET